MVGAPRSPTSQRHGSPIITGRPLRACCASRSAFGRAHPCLFNVTLPTAFGSTSPVDSFLCRDGLPRAWVDLASADKKVLAILALGEGLPPSAVTASAVCHMASRVHWPPGSGGRNPGLGGGGDRPRGAAGAQIDGYDRGAVVGIGTVWRPLPLTHCQGRTFEARWPPPPPRKYPGPMCP